MRTKEILLLEKENTNKIHLLKEGLFWRAYNVSAFLFIQHIQTFKLTKKYVKIADAVVIFLGFPDTILDKILVQLISKGSIIKQED